MPRARYSFACDQHYKQLLLDVVELMQLLLLLALSPYPCPLFVHSVLWFMAKGYFAELFWANATELTPTLLSFNDPLLTYVRREVIVGLFCRPIMASERVVVCCVRHNHHTLSVSCRVL